MNVDLRTRGSQVFESEATALEQGDNVVVALTQARYFGSVEKAASDEISLIAKKSDVLFGQCCHAARASSITFFIFPVSSCISQPASMTSGAATNSMVTTPSY